MLYFDYPLSERIRNFVRICRLHERFDEALAADNKWMQHVAVCTLFEITECASRADVKRDLLHELERQRMQLVSKEVADEGRLAELNGAIAGLQAHKQSAQSLRENEWLTAFRQRLNIAGSTTAAELPSYHYWLNQSPQQCRDYLGKWIGAARPVLEAVRVVMDSLNRHTQTMSCTAVKGVYQHGGLIETTQLLRIGVAAEQGVVPDVSANKYFTNISFLQANQESTRSKLAEKDLPFELVLCRLDA